MNELEDSWVEKSIAHLISGELEITGRLVDASNATLFGVMHHEGSTLEVIYKPIAGERPLWDFPDGTLADREYVAFLLSDKTGMDLVPPTILREGPAGLGMVQRWIDVDESIDLGSYFAQDRQELRRLALFDAIINNTDRKIGHLLPDQRGHLFACDHGVTFHTENKLRTVLWQWAGDALTEEEIGTLDQTLTFIDVNTASLSVHLTNEEIEATCIRISKLRSDGIMPLPSEDWPAIPWPAY
jgi:uncharacterized repeat protein (TIGR03843 family)